MDTNAAKANPDGTYDINAIMAILPHRYPILLIDRVLEVEPQTRILARKCVTINESFFQGHFPGYPLMPAVMQVEAIAQAAALLMLINEERPKNALMLFTGVEKARFRRPVTPGDVLNIEVKVLHKRSRAVRVSGTIHVDGKLVCEAVVTSQLVQRDSTPATPKPAAENTPEETVAVPAE